MNERNQPNGGPPKSKKEDGSNRCFAVIYGAGNKAGKAFAYYLMEKGFNLILIERDQQTLEGLE